MMKNRAKIFSILLLSAALASCGKHAPKEVEQTPLVSVKTTRVSLGDIESTVSLNGKIIYLKKNSIVSPISGYVLKVHVKFGAYVQKNDLLFEIQTKENKALENTTASNVGIIKVFASFAGVINILNITETGSYVVEGTPLCTIIENKSAMVQVNVPFEYNLLTRMGTTCKMFLADRTTLTGTVYQVLPIIDETNQTQQVLIKPITSRLLPENLNLTVQFVKVKHSRSMLVPKVAVMTNETQSEFWIMKIVNDKLAVKVPIAKGIENDSVVEVLSANLRNNEMVISEGAYGLPDSSVVRIER